MNIWKLIAIVGLLAAAGFAVVSFRSVLFPTVQPEAAFNVILNLTPGQLQMGCGMPTTVSMGVVSDGAGVQDLLYKSSSGDEIVFRFISNDGKNWQSLGAWERVHAPDFLGIPLDALDAGGRMSCVAKDAQAALPNETSGWPTDLAMLSPQAIGEMLSPTQHGPPPMPTTLPKGAVGTPSSRTGQYVVQVPSSQFELPPKSEPYWKSDDSDLMRHARPSCPADAQPCLMVSYAEFNSGMNRVIHAELDNDFQGALNRLTQHGTVVVELPSAEQERIAAIDGVLRLEVEAVNILEYRLRDDLSQLEPTARDSPNLKTRKVAALMHADRVRRLLWKQAISANRPPAGVWDSHPDRHSGNSMSFKTVAYQQMVEIHQTGSWP